MICLCVVRWMALTSVLWIPCVRKAAPRGFRKRAGVFIWWASVVWRWSNCPRRVGVAASRESVSVESVAAIRAGMTVCQADHGAAASLYSRTHSESAHAERQAEKWRGHVSACEL